MPPSDELSRIQEMVRACIQCGTCSASCPNEFAMDYTPRRLWRLVLLGQTEEIFSSRTFTLCSDCYCCTLRCPRGLPLTETMEALKQMASKECLHRYRSSLKFYECFIRSVRYHGRVNEIELMGLYFAALHNPLVPFKYAPLGIRLMLKGKVARFPTMRRRPLEALFRKVAELELEEAQ